MPATGVVSTATLLKKPKRCNRSLDAIMSAMAATPPSIWRISRRNTSSLVRVLPRKSMRRTYVLLPARTWYCTSTVFRFSLINGTGWTSANANPWSPNSWRTSWAALTKFRRENTCPDEALMRFLISASWTSYWPAMLTVPMVNWSPSAKLIVIKTLVLSAEIATWVDSILNNT